MTTASTGWLDWFVPKTLGVGALDLHRRARLFVVASVGLALVAVFFNWQGYVTEGWQLSNSVLTLGAIIAVSNLATVRLTGSLELPSVVLSFLLVGTLAVLGYVGCGYLDPSLWWLPAGPLIGAFLVGPRFGVVVALSILMVDVGFFGLERAGHKFAPMPPDFGWFTLLGTTTLTACIAAFAWLYEASRTRAVLQLERAHDEVKEADLKTRSINEALSRAHARAKDDASSKDAFLAQMRRTAALQESALEETRTSVAAMASAIRTIADGVATLAGATEESSTAITAVESQSGEVGTALAAMLRAGLDASAAIDAMQRSVQKNAAATDELSRAAVETGAAMRELDESISGVERQALATADLSHEMRDNADRGNTAVSRTVEGMELIRQSAADAGASIRALGGRIGDIGAILTVIEEVANQTNLLALNASIIASQAGSHGRGFAVVADEIKNLAQRTGRSTQEIAGLIQDVQKRSHEAVLAIDRGDDAVAAGLVRSREAATTLAEIVASAEKSTSTIRAIAGAAVAQARTTRGVQKSMEHVNKIIADVVTATTAQTKGSEQIARAAERLRQLSPRVESGAQEQTRGGQRVREAVLRIKAMTQKLNEAQREQTRGSEQILRAIDTIHGTQQKQVESIDAMDVERA